MYDIRRQEPTDVEPEPTIDITNMQPAEETILAEQTMVLDDSSTSVNVKIVAITHDLALDSEAPIGKPVSIGQRTLCGMILENEDGTRRSFVQSIAGPLRFHAHQAREPQLTRERMALSRVRANITRIGRAALRRTDLITPMPNAKNTESELYEATAPGILLNDAMYAVQTAYDAGRISRDEAANILTSMHDAAASSLASFHGLKLVHRDANLKNFCIDPATGNVQLIDYTFATKKNFNLRWLQRDGLSGVEDKTPADDRAHFETEWNRVLASIDLSTRDSHLNDEERKLAAAKLERAVALAALHEATGRYPSEGEIDRFIDIQHDLISGAPTVTYPQAA